MNIHIIRVQEEEERRSVRSPQGRVVLGVSEMRGDGRGRRDPGKGPWLDRHLPLRPASGSPASAPCKDAETCVERNLNQLGHLKDV